VRIVLEVNPPSMVIARGAHKLEPSLVSNAIGINPRMVAATVSQMGRKRLWDAERAAFSIPQPSSMS